MSSSEMFMGGLSGHAEAEMQPQEFFLATGLGSRGGPNKVSNKLRRNPQAYLSGESAPTEFFLATGLRSRGGPNKVSNKLKRCPSSYLFH